MIDNLKCMIKAATADQKGATALEYALIAGALCAVTLVGFNAFFARINAFLTGLVFTSS